MNCRDYVLDMALKEANPNGLILEFGVFKGRTINQIAKFFHPRDVFGFDSFQGLPEDWREGYEKGKFSTDGELPKVDKNVTLIKGLFQDTLQPFLDSTEGDIGFVNIDCDLYSSTKYVLETLKSSGRLVKGTVLYFDEFMNTKFSDEYKAYRESEIDAELFGCFISKKSSYSSFAFKIR